MRLPAAVLAIGLIAAPAAAAQLTPEQITDLMKGNVIIGTDGGGAFCSGTMIGNRVILTAAHCVKQQYRDEVRDEVNAITGEVTKKTYRVAEDIQVWQNKYNDFEVVSSTRLAAKVLAQNTDTDQALIQIRDADYIPPRVIAIAPIDYAYEVTKPCYVIGNSFGVLDASVSPCTIASSQRKLNLGGKNTKLVQLNSGAVGGNSGGAVIDAETGQLIGTLVAGASGTTINFMVPVNLSREFIEKNTPK